jgi:hypothetical protein
MPFYYPSGRGNALYRPIGKKFEGRPLYEVVEPFSYSVKAIDGMYRYPQIEVEAGFITDLASIPRLPIIPTPKPNAPLWDDAAIVHDVAVASLRSRREADAIFYHALLDRGCTIFTATVFHIAVRLNAFIKRRA